MKYEYKTTYGDLFAAHEHIPYVCPSSGRCGYQDQLPDDPIAPVGDGWELLHTSASNRLYWTWRRQVNQ